MLFQNIQPAKQLIHELNLTRQQKEIMRFFYTFLPLREKISELQLIQHQITLAL